MKYIFIILFFLVSILHAQDRVIILADPNILTTKETDDAMSLVRLMVYSNEFDIEGLIATCSHNYGFRHVEPFYNAIDAYETSLPNLRIHANGYPDPNKLRDVTVLGPRLYGTEFALNEEPISEGAQLIINAIDKDDDRPIWIQIWGDGAVIVQALEHIRINQGQSAANSAADKLRIYDIAGQDDSGAWLKSADNYPNLFYIRGTTVYMAMDPMSDNWSIYIPPCGECSKGDTYYTDDAWVANNIQNHGALGDVYPDRKYLKEGDTPALLYIIPNGLNDPEKPWMGSWGGRYTRTPILDVRSNRHPLGDWDEYTETEFDPYPMYGSDEDTWSYDGNTYTNQWTGIFRWWPEFQNDFAARMDWSIQSSYSNANHPPVINEEIKYISAFKGDILNLSYLDITDPDGNILNYKWWYYKEPGTYSGEVVINNSEELVPEIIIPEDSENKEIHIILSVTDSGHPALTRYHRVVINVFETFVDIIPPSIPEYLKDVRI